MIAENLIGVWQRESIRIGDGKPFEDSRVFWLQGHKRYADFRVPLAGSDAAQQASAGNQTWREPTLQFHHELDLSQSASKDAGELSWDGEILLENGSVTLNERVIHYEERWQRITPKHVDSNVWEIRSDANTLNALAIRVGDYAAIVARTPDFSAVLFHQLENGWQQSIQIGAQADFKPRWDEDMPVGNDNSGWIAVR